MVELLSVDRGETIVAAAWAIRKLDVPELLPKVHAYYQSVLPRLKDHGVTAGRKFVKPDDMDLHLAQLGQFFGRRKYRPAEDVLREIIPPTLRGRNPTPVGYEARAAAVWALGLMHEGVVEPRLVRLATGRLDAVMGVDVEDPRVRRMSAIALGRMKAKANVEILRKYFVDKRPTLDSVNNACGWALEQITGEKMEPAGVVEVNDLDWFLNPVK